MHSEIRLVLSGATVFSRRGHRRSQHTARITRRSRPVGIASHLDSKAGRHSQSPGFQGRPAKLITLRSKPAGEANHPDSKAVRQAANWDRTGFEGVISIAGTDILIV